MGISIPLVIAAAGIGSLSGASGEAAVPGDDTLYQIDPIIVTATRTETPRDQTVNSITVIDNREITEARARTGPEILRGLPGLHIAEAGGAGKTASLFIRGGNSEHTLVLVDGVEMNDPISTGRGFNFADLSMDNIERIEIVRGPQSTLYGSDAIGGVINIITAHETETPSFYCTGEFGSYRTIRGSAGVRGKLKGLGYSLSLSRTDMEGFSAASAARGNSERDGYSGTAFSGHLAAAPLDNLSISVSGRYLDSRSDIDNTGGRGGDDPNHVVDCARLAMKTRARLSLLNDRWSQGLSLHVTDYDRTAVNGTDPDHPVDTSHTTFDSRLIKLDWQHNVRAGAAGIITIGAEAEEERGASSFYSLGAWGPYSSRFEEQRARTAALYLQDQTSPVERLFLTVGGRVDHIVDLGTSTTFRAGAAYTLSPTDTRLHATFGTGFKAPSLYQRYSEYGDENLSPEKSRGWDLGARQPFFARSASVGATLFSNTYEDLIEYNSAASMYRNVNTARSRGMEAAVSLHLLRRIDLRLDYTYTDAVNLDTGKRLLQRPKHQVKWLLGYRPLDNAMLRMETIYVGRKYDYPRVTVPEYRVVNLVASYGITEMVSVFVKGNNVLDEEYEEVAGYGTPGASAYTGVAVRF